MEKKKQSLFSNHGPLCFVHLFFKSQLTFLQVNRLIVLPPSHTALIHIRSLWGDLAWKQNLWFGVQNRIWQSTEAHHIHLYRYAHSSFYISCILLIMWFPLYSFHFFYTHLTLKKEKSTPLFTQLTEVILQNTCIKD